MKLDVNYQVLKINKGKLYILGLEDESDRILVIDLASGDLLYEGEIILKKDNNVKHKTHNIQFHDISFK